MKRFLPTLLLALTLSACSSDTPAPTPSSPAPSAPVSPSVSATPAPTTAAPPIWGIQTGEYRQTVTDQPDQPLVEGLFTLPHIENADGSAPYSAINRWYAQLLDDLKGDVTSNVAQAMDDYDSSRSLGLPFPGYSDEEVYALVYQSADTAAILRTHYAYTGDTYPTLLYMVDRFDLQTGAILSFADIFTDPEGAQAIILAEIERQGTARGGYDLAALTSAFQREYFYPTEEGFLFFYQPLTLNDQAAEKPEFLVPYALLEGLFTL